MDEELHERLERSGYGRPGFAAAYERYRPRPPSVLLELLPRLLGVERPRLVVDLGSGTGLSTRLWAGAADEVVGVEPNDAMRTLAEDVTTAANVRYLAGSSHATGLPSASADLVTAAQSLQWMRREQTFAEIGRVLRAGGLFCAYNYAAFQLPDWEAAAAFEAVRERTRDRQRQLGLESVAVGQPTLAWLEESGIFRHTRELFLHSLEYGDGDRLVGFALSEGSTQAVLDAGADEADLGLDRLRRAAVGIPTAVPWWLGYRAWIGLK